jgi:hypothetical protein
MNTNMFHLIGKHGEIKSINGTTCQAIITSDTVAHAYLGKSSRSSNKAITINFPNSELDKWIKRLEVSSTHDGMIRFASEFFD